MSEGVETEAREMGWRPQEEFKGDPEKWVDAATFLERGKSVMPILRKDNEKLHQTVGHLNGEVQRLNNLLKDSQESIQALMEFHDQDSKRRVEAAIRKVKQELATAHEAGDHEAISELTDQLVDLKAAVKDTPADKPPKKDDKPAPKDMSQEPWFLAWRDKNKWYGTDEARTDMANAVAARLRASGNQLIGGEFLDEVARKVEENIAKFGGPPSADRVHGGGASGRGGAEDGGKTYSDLPAEAKATCERQAAKMVGDGRAFKTKKDWQTYYTNLFFKE